MTARKSAPAKHHGGGNGQDAVVRQGERNPTHLDAQDHKKERKRAQKSAGPVTAGTHTFPAQRLNKPNVEANLKRVAMDAATGTQGSGKGELAVNTAFQDHVGNLDTSDGPLQSHACSALSAWPARRRAAQPTQRRDQRKCDRAGARLDAAQSQQPSGQHGKEIYRRHARERAAPPEEIAPAFVLIAARWGPSSIAAAILLMLCALLRRMRRQGLGKASGEATMMQQGHTPRDRAMTPIWSVCGPIFSLGAPSSRRIPREWSWALTTTGGNPATLKAL
jgi:hypothetical protein